MMNNFKIYNEADSAKVEILGVIGESWFEDGNTLESVKAQLEGLDVSVLGPDLAARGIGEDKLADGVKVVDYAAFVDLVEAKDKVQSWL